ncbi:iron-sulfur cluster assembly accessory protein [Rhodoblastus sphagnicola]|uniref:Iron-sulfur cluster assembly accessory protein n=1 Tax=Rhodoblastus sphagnicola TaxID=333368 RepID=A0A2S6N8G0_9HYPH|nr:iron-sulfur cluster assembly accessory protein [Rhodoblastus sphagnicola]MBB4198129.1 iron-sulfur cluster assembly accessory protein [Rhodoblastus sphagnicola]PPQ30906.1 iron-sulfur cluster assembly accessory protein [Rhodoblastus sphagnicola]
MLILTRPAIAAIESSLIANDKQGQGVRITAEAGCSGPKYSMRIEPDPAPHDTVVEIRDVRVFMDDGSATILAGATVDYSEDPDNFGFSFALALPTEEQASTCTSPKPAGGCGCGKPS